MIRLHASAMKKGACGHVEKSVALTNGFYTTGNWMTHASKTAGQTASLGLVYGDSLWRVSRSR